MSAGRDPDAPEGRDSPDAPDIPAPLADFLNWMRGRLVAVGHGLLLFGLAVAGLALLAGLVGLLVLVVRLVTRGEIHHHIQFVVPLALLGIAAWLAVGALILLWTRRDPGAGPGQRDAHSPGQ